MTILWPGETNPDDIRPQIIKALEFCWDVQDSSMARWMGYDGYVQWAGWPEGVQIECSGAPTNHQTITPQARKVMRSLGFQEPDDDMPNWFRRITAREDLPEAAAALTACLFEVLAPDPLRTPEPVEPARAVVTLAPVGKLTSTSVGAVAQRLAHELAFSGPVMVLDAYDFRGCLTEIPGFRRISFAEYAATTPTPCPGADRLLVQQPEKREVNAELCAAAEVALAADDARRAGWTILLIAPLVFFPSYWIYEQAVLPLTDGLVVLRESHQRREGHYDRDVKFITGTNPGKYWNDPLTVEVDLEGPALTDNSGRYVLPAEDGAGASPAWLPSWVRYFAP